MTIELERAQNQIKSETFAKQSIEERQAEFENEIEVFHELQSAILVRLTLSLELGRAEASA